MNIDFLRPGLNRLQRYSLRGGGLLLVACVVWGFFNPPQFFRSYLLAFMLWLGLTLGCLSVLMMQYLFQGNWGFIIQRICEAGSRNIVLMTLLVVPLLFGVREIYTWADPAIVAASPKLLRKTWYLNVPWWVGRAVIYFIVWNALAYFLTKWSREQDVTGNWLLINKLKALSAPGLILYGLTISFATVDWVMSLQPEWYSTIFGMIFMTGQTLFGVCFCIVVTNRIAFLKPVQGVYKPEWFHDLGNVTLTFVMLWAYTSFAQLLIIWAGNLPDEILYFERRLSDIWGVLAGGLILFHFFVPFMLLLMRPMKRYIGRLAIIAWLLMVMRWVDLYWMIVPAFHPRAYLHLLDVMLPLGMGGLWLAAFAWQFKAANLFPINDPRAESVLPGVEK